MRALAEKWGVGRLLKPAAIRALLDQNAAGGWVPQFSKCDTAVADQISLSVMTLPLGGTSGKKDLQQRDDFRINSRSRMTSTISWGTSAISPVRDSPCTWSISVKSQRTTRGARSTPPSSCKPRLKQTAGAHSQDDGFSFSAMNNNMDPTEPAHPAKGSPSPPRGDGGGGRRISWERPVASPSPLGTPRTSAGKGVASNRTPGSNGGSAAGEENGDGEGGNGYNRGIPKSATALGWSDGFTSLPDVQMQALVEVGRLVRAAARKGKGGRPCKQYL